MVSINTVFEEKEQEKIEGKGFITPSSIFLKARIRIKDFLLFHLGDKSFF